MFFDRTPRDTYFSRRDITTENRSRRKVTTEKTVQPVDVGYG